MDQNINIFESLGLPSEPIFLAPLAGVSDIPFRVICSERGADLTYVEMLSAVALTYKSKRTFEMLARHAKEKILGVQLTAKNAEDMEKAILVLNQYPFETVDINMGCPVRKVVGSGCGAAVTRDPENAYAITKAAVQASIRPVSVKYRLGWDRTSLNYLEVASALESAGAKWLTIHGRTRSDDYSREVDLEAIAQIKKQVKIPVLGNGNIFSYEDYKIMKTVTQVDGIMVSRGALGNPWIFQEIRGQREALPLNEWTRCIRTHIELQKELYGDSFHGLVMMRKHLLWYLKGWPGAKIYRETLMGAMSFDAVHEILGRFIGELGAQNVHTRTLFTTDQDSRFLWNPNREMDREADAAVFE
jgi:tRNA-dihydrouridine synthase B